jgi:hypothetical protein
LAIVRQARPKLITKERKFRVIVIVRSLTVFTIDDLRFLRMHHQAAACQSLTDRLQHIDGLLLGLAVHYDIVGVSFERYGSKFLPHPEVKDVMQKQICELFDRLVQACITAETVTYPELVHGSLPEKV